MLTTYYPGVKIHAYKGKEALNHSCLEPLCLCFYHWPMITEEKFEEIDMEEILSEVFGIWFLIGAAFVFFMQAGFAMVEAGLTRAKNAGNIIMKNLMDFCLGTVAFLIIGYSFLCGQDFCGLIGWG